MGNQLTSLNRDRLDDLTHSGERQVIISQGAIPVHIHPDVGVSLNELMFSSIASLATIRIFYTQGSEGFSLDISDEFIILQTGNETAASEYRFYRDIIITPAQNNETNEPIVGSLTINFKNYMAFNTIIITQSDAEGLRTLEATGAGLSGTVLSTNTGATNRSTFTGEEGATDTINIVVRGEQRAEYRLSTDNSALFTSDEFGREFILRGGGANSNRVHAITVAERGLTDVNGFIRVTNVNTPSNALTLFLQQTGDNVPVLTITPTSSLDPVRGDSVNYDWTISGADTGAGVLQISSDNFSTIDSTIDITTDGDGDASGSSSIVPLSNALYRFRFIDSGNRTSSVQSFTVSPGTPIPNATSESDEWFVTTTSLSHRFSGLTIAQSASLNASNFTVVQDSPTSDIGVISAVTWVPRRTLGNLDSGVATYNITNAGVNTSTRNNLPITYTITLLVGEQEYTISGIWTRTVRDINSLTFGTPSPTISFDTRNITFTVRRDVDEPNLTLMDVPDSVVDQDIWSDSRLTLASVSPPNNPGLSNVAGNLQTYIRESSVTITGGSTNISEADMVDQIVVTSSR